MSKRLPSWLMTGVALQWLFSAAAQAAARDPDTVVVCPAEFREALAPWLAHREQQGHRMALVSNLHDAASIRAEIARIAKQAAAAGGRLRFVVLVGDADPGLTEDTALRGRSTPAAYVPAKVNLRWGSEPQIVTDNRYADLDGDRLPDLAVGRLTADSPAELAMIVEKILAYERGVDFGPWRRRINFVAGVGGFGRVADTALELATKKLISDGLPAEYATTMTYASWTSPYCPDPREFCNTTIQRLNEGCLFWVYIGHGHVSTLDWMRTPRGMFPIFSSPDVPKLQCAAGSPIAWFLSCYTGAFDQREDCLAEQMLRSPGGPVAIVCGSRVTMPYAMSIMSMEFIRGLSGADRPETLGEAFVAAKRRMMAAGGDENRKALDALAMLISPAPVDLEAERAEHLDIFNLVGDPLLRLPVPRAIELRVAPTAVAGKTASITVISPIDGKCTVELTARRDRLTFDPPDRREFDTAPRALEAYQAVYRRANDARLSEAEIAVKAGIPFTVALLAPDYFSGPSYVRAFVEGSQAYAQGACALEISRPQSR